MATVEPKHITDAKRSAEKTGFITVVVIWFLIVIGVVLLTINDLSHGRFLGSLWVSYACLVLMAASLVRMARRRARERPRDAVDD